VAFLGQQIESFEVAEPERLVGATGVFGFFLGRYTTFYLTQGPDVFLPGGRPVFPGVPSETPEQVLARNGLVPSDRVILDPD